MFQRLPFQVLQCHFRVEMFQDAPVDCFTVAKLVRTSLYIICYAKKLSDAGIYRSVEKTRLMRLVSSEKQTIMVELRSKRRKCKIVRVWVVLIKNQILQKYICMYLCLLNGFEFQGLSTDPT